MYCTDFQGTNEAIPDDAVIETEDNRLGHIKGGAEIEYAPESYEAKDDMGKVSKVIITEEEATLKSGIMTWCGTTLEKLCQTARVTEDKAKGIRTVKLAVSETQRVRNTFCDLSIKIPRTEISV